MPLRNPHCRHEHGQVMVANDTIRVDSVIARSTAQARVGGPGETRGEPPFAVDAFDLINKGFKFSAVLTMTVVPDPCHSSNKSS